MGMVLAVFAGLLISVQTVFNARVSIEAGSWATTSFVMGLGFISSLPLFFLLDQGSLFQLNGMNPFYLISGVLGVGLIFFIMKSVHHLGPAAAISIVLVSQLAVAVMIDAFGLFGFSQVPFTWNQAAGLFLLAAGIVVFKREPGKKLSIALRRSA
ncbi:DMT family transporter [Jeotgalibacillus sp. R-1-5s-1]|uniref:DMT family transporter n=1 Tax=Jeotgalibacillus sp. R-1-5s-1 TaxID=2555897 RepID=UPI00106B782B|nr:DMT family transporter [Jeotgalibacillus sp. R-1-5s-1]TFE00079.1 DMT family transporter [Jeotgalibacillus sp. R-1-5s-1]